jgi:hypothetical protein
VVSLYTGDERSNYTFSPFFVNENVVDNGGELLTLATVLIQMTGRRGSINNDTYDFKACREALGWESGWIPNNRDLNELTYTWHHVFLGNIPGFGNSMFPDFPYIWDASEWFDTFDKSTVMQLVLSRVHNKTKQHIGSCYQYALKFP